MDSLKYPKSKPQGLLYTIDLTCINFKVIFKNVDKTIYGILEIKRLAILLDKDFIKTWHISHVFHPLQVYNSVILAYS